MLGTVEEQARREQENITDAYVKYIQSLEKAKRNKRFAETKEGMLIMRLGFFRLRDKIQEYFDSDQHTRGRSAKDKKYLMYLCDDPNILAYSVITTCINETMTSRNMVRRTALVNNITSNLVRYKWLKGVEETDPKLVSYLGREYFRASKKRKQELLEEGLKELGERTLLEKFKSQNIRVGALLLDLFIKSGAGIITQKKTIKSYTYITFTEEVFDIFRHLFEFENWIELIHNIGAAPMICKPIDRTSFTVGGFIVRQPHFVLTKLEFQKRFYEKQDFSKVFPIINKLQSIEWRVNKRVYDVMSDVFEYNMVDPKSPRELPRLYGNLPTKELYTPEDLIGPPPETEDGQVWDAYQKKKRKKQLDLDSELTRRLQYYLTMDKVEDVIDYDKIWFVWLADYRGRLYPRADYFHPQGSGWVKSMLEFANGEKLNEEGEYWLKVHTANTYGLDKKEYDERVEWVEKNMDMILKTASAPFECLSFWTEADSPYEFLASCFAWQDHVEGKEVHLPIQLDATCSGIQMYSGILYDKEGGETVNIVGDKRNDIYQVVADEVNRRLLNSEYDKTIAFKDKEGVDRIVSTKVEAKSIAGKVTRSMVKRNVMTIPYSVTIRGMQDQNWHMMHEMKVKGQDFWEGDPWVVNKLLTHLIWLSAYNLLKGASLGQNYLRDVAKAYSDKPLIWYSPIYKFPIFQAAFDYNMLNLKTPLGNMAVRITNEKHISKRRQGNGIAPNYIHSIDATVLYGVIDKADFEVSGVHDCFLSHPNYGGQVQNYYKEVFYELLKLNPLKDFSKQVDKESKVEIPCVCTLEPEEVLDAKYIIS